MAAVVSAASPPSSPARARRSTTTSGRSEKNVNRRRAIGGDAVNFIAKFDIDDDTTELSLEAQYYDPSPSADYESWLLLEADGEEVERRAPSRARERVVCTSQPAGVMCT